MNHTVSYQDLKEYEVGNVITSCSATRIVMYTQINWQGYPESWFEIISSKEEIASGNLKNAIEAYNKIIT